MKLLLSFAAALSVGAQAPCVMNTNHDTFEISHVEGKPALTLDEHSPHWQRAKSQVMWKDCQRQVEYPDRKTTIKAFWTETDLYVLFRCPYGELNLFQPPNHTTPRVGLWDRDVVEMFVGDDWTNINRYREFEIAPTGDWIDLAIDLDRHSFDHTWRSGWESMARVDETNKIWYAAARIPLKAISDHVVKVGTKWRLNFYRIDGLGQDAQRHFMCWQPTCDAKRGNHVPESFGTLVFGK